MIGFYQNLDASPLPRPSHLSWAVWGLFFFALKGVCQLPILPAPWFWAWLILASSVTCLTSVFFTDVQWQYRQRYFLLLPVRRFSAQAPQAGWWAPYPALAWVDCWCAV